MDKEYGEQYFNGIKYYFYFVGNDRFFYLVKENALNFSLGWSFIYNGTAWEIWDNSNFLKEFVGTKEQFEFFYKKFFQMMAFS